MAHLQRHNNPRGFWLTAAQGAAAFYRFVSFWFLTSVLSEIMQKGLVITAVL